LVRQFFTDKPKGSNSTKGRLSGKMNNKYIFLMREGATRTSKRRRGFVVDGS
jgi:hypothetical protein